MEVVKAFIGKYNGKLHPWFNMTKMKVMLFLGNIVLGDVGGMTKYCFVKSGRLFLVCLYIL